MGTHLPRRYPMGSAAFPSNLESYCHRIGRVGRQGSKGWSLSFFTRNLQPMAGSLAALLERCGQWVDPNLRELADPSLDLRRRTAFSP
ncbi:unnamed protein product [Prorocentrum cordatum]|uniref:Helicase C-terminal domain-containing protein n=1 Tax=Prorocentrum cordatum TaxID=2364126 RepID=A0ABN9VBH6_9DINO|nr:unnamed protein product [Polarella glacialis]